MSTTTLLQAVNRVLLDIGERPVTTFNSPVARKAVSYLQDSLTFIQSAHDWEFLYDRIIATNWSNDTATVDCQQIRSVGWDNLTTIQPVGYIDVQHYDTQNIQPFNSDLNTSYRPLNYTITNYNTIRINPYPINPNGQSRVLFYVIRNMTVGNNPNDIFPIPEKYMSLLYYRADYMLALRHLQDSNAAQFFDKDFNELLQRYRNQENKSPTSGMNMYKRRVRRFPYGI